MLRTFRFAVACLSLSGFCLLFLNPAGLFIPRVLARFQLVPALLAGSTAVAAALLIATLLFGRVYCSVLCPLGLLQDAVSRLGTGRRFRYAPARTGLRTFLLLLFLAAFIAGIPAVFGLLEPYSAFGRIAATLFMPIGQAANRLAGIGSASLGPRGVAPLATALFTLAVIGWLSLKSGRTWCNTLCPVGTLLGILSRFSLFRIAIDREACVRCGLCASRCKAACIDARQGTVDTSRCVACFNCLDPCRHGAIAYAPSWRRGAPRTGNGRRSFLIKALGLPFVPVLTGRESGGAGTLPEDSPGNLITPPGSGSLRHFRQHCTGCQLCVAACPNHVLVPSDRGLGLLQPAVSFAKGYCKIDCVACASVCPTGAIGPVRRADRRTIQVGTAGVDWDRCLVNTDQKECRICSDACPTKAVSLIGAPGLSKWLAVMPEYCIGCGACEHACPVTPAPAIHVLGHAEHRRIQERPGKPK